MAPPLKHTKHAVDSWNSFMYRSFVLVPAMLRQAQSHRAALNTLLHKHGGK